MKKPKFRIGDKVKNRHGIFSVIDFIPQKAVATYAIKVYADGHTGVSSTTLAQTWLYKLDEGISL